MAPDQVFVLGGRILTNGMEIWESQLVAVKVTPQRVSSLVENVTTNEEEEQTRVRFVRGPFTTSRQLPQDHAL